MRLRPKSVFFSLSGGQRAGYTLVEILVALTLTLILMTAVVRVFGGVGEGIAKARRAMEQFDRLRTAQQQLRIDLQGLTVTPDGRPARPEENRGYLEFIEGGILSLPQASGNPPALQLLGSGSPQAINPQSATSLPFDLAVGERGDILMFTTRNADRPFVGRYALSADPTNPTMQSDVAEVAWFLRGKTLHRRVLLVAPGVAQNPQFSQLASSTFFAYNDISVRLVNGQVVPNTLGDLTKRENRFAHPASQSPGFPFDARVVGGSWDFPRCTNALRRRGCRNRIGSTAPRPRLRLLFRLSPSRSTIGTTRVLSKPSSGRCPRRPRRPRRPRPTSSWRTRPWTALARPTT